MSAIYWLLALLPLMLGVSIADAFAVSRYRISTVDVIADH
jgi:hypothetical protein